MAVSKLGKRNVYKIVSQVIAEKEPEMKLPEMKECDYQWSGSYGSATEEIVCVLEDGCRLKVHFTCFCGKRMRYWLFNKYGAQMRYVNWFGVDAA